MSRNTDDPSGDVKADSVASERQELTGGAFYAKTIFDRHQVATTERSRLAEKVLGIAYSAAHRRVKGEFEWKFSELAAIAAHFGESLDEVFFSAAKTRAFPATYVAGDVHLACHVWVGQELSRPEAGSLVASREGTRWMVGRATAESTGPVYEVRQLLIEPNSAQPARIAVLDDQPAITESLCAFLEQAGFMADAFHSISALQSELSSVHYDAYVLDWAIGQHTVGVLVEQLRSADAQCPIFILTGKANERGDVVADIAGLVAKHDVRYFSKPLDPHMITAVLSHLVPRRERT